MNAEPKLEGGVLLELPRDQAKTFFSIKGDDAVLEFVNTLLVDGNTLSTDGAYQRLAEKFGDEPPLVWCLLGGRPMYQGDDHQVMLVRPDMVGHVATKLTEMNDSELTDLAGDDLTTLQAVRAHYDAAAKNGSAMIFAARV